ncbi:hypothetical protein TNCV_4736791 [Trichonephila clavipes]|nr:hypothetical protein TNCV_4736791 [Trichonephila clavipes]
MEIDRDDRRIYRNCDNCLDTELAPAHIFDCPAILAALQEIGVLFFRQQPLYGLPEQLSGPMVMCDLIQHEHDAIIIIIIIAVKVCRR